MSDQTLIEIISGCAAPLFAFLSGLFTYSRLNTFYRLIFLQVVFYILTICGAYAVTIYQDAYGLPNNNQWLYNLSFPVECAILAGAAVVYFGSRKAAVAIVAGYAVFMLVYVVQIIGESMSGLANYAIAMEGLLMVVVYLLVLYSRFKESLSAWAAVPEFWLCLGIAVYFGCVVPYFSMFGYLWRHYPDASLTLFNIINLVFSNMRYILVGVSFWLVYRQSRLLYNKSV